LFASQDDASLLFARSTGGPPVHYRGGPVGPTPAEATTIIASDQKRVAKVLELRKQAEAEQEDSRVMAMDSQSPPKKTLGAKVKGCLPFGKGGFLHRRKIKRAKAHLHEVEVTLTRRGKVEVKMDGTVVLRKSGSSFVGWRVKDSTYELHTISTGLVVTRAGKLDWSVLAEFS
ncbi:unnamed protein product, partial [Hapterophycus canaliculatus]